MRAWLQGTADLAIIGLCILVAATAMERRAAGPAGVYAVGDRLEGVPADALQARRTLVLAVSSVCELCTRSMPFYRRLVELRSSSRPLGIIAWTFDTVEVGQRYLDEHGVRPDRVIAIDRGRPGVRGTPTLLLVDGRGVVEAVWEGLLGEEQEREVVAHVLGDR